MSGLGVKDFSPAFSTTTAEMNTLITRLTDFRQQIAFEVERFMLLWSYQHHTPPFRLWWRLVLKRAVDILGSAIVLTLLSPAMLMIALLLKGDSPGPVLFAQERVGRFGRMFRIYKFRTMICNAESTTGPVWAQARNDPRVTRFGRFLRQSHLDELPQLWNVLVGTMSLVGPRPERPCFVKTLAQDIPRYDHRLYVRPGMTGLAQVHYRYDRTISDVKQKLRFDLLYVKRMCLMLDVRILAWTLIVVLTGRGVR